MDNGENRCVAAVLPIVYACSETFEIRFDRAAYTLFSKLQKAEERVAKEGWIDADDLEKELGVIND